nr:DTW domain-containing protein [Halopseudomonas salina]
MTKPLKARCAVCLRPANFCLCALIPTLQCATRILVIQHPQEQKHALNTGRLLVAGLAHADLLVAEQLPPDSPVLQQISDPAWFTELLFPGERAQLPVPAQSGDERPRRLVLIDGTWRKARKILMLNPVLQNLPRVCLPGGLVSRYRLRKTRVPDALSTIEAGVHALQMIEPDRDYSALLHPFEALIEGQIEAMGVECYERNHSPLVCGYVNSRPAKD